MSQQAIRDQDLVILFDRIPIPKRYFDNWREPATWACQWLVGRRSRGGGSYGAPEIFFPENGGPQICLVAEKTSFYQKEEIRKISFS